MPQPRLHIVGAGLAGLSCAVRAVDAGIPVTVHEAAPQAGGRCRSYHDDVLDRWIDNGNHLLLSGNSAAMAYIRTIGSENAFAVPPETAFPFLDLESGESWTLRPNDGPVPWWVLSGRRRVKGTRPADYLGGVRLFSASARDTVADCVDGASSLYRRFWDPLTVAALNAPPDRAAARLLRPVLTRTFLKGGAYCRPMVARDGLSDALVAPAVDHIRARRGDIRFGARLTGLERKSGRVTALDFAGGAIPLGEGDAVVLGLPPAAVRQLLPEVIVPEGASPIVNAHFRVDGAGDGRPLILGLVGGAAQWLFFRGDIVSVTVSAAEDMVAADAGAIADRLWRDVAAATGIGGATPPARIVKEKRATFAQTPDNLARRPGPATSARNLFLAGDWTATGLPASIEGAVTSGFRAAALAGPAMRAQQHVSAAA